MINRKSGVFHHDNTWFYTTNKTSGEIEARKKIQHPSYFPALVPSDYLLFWSLFLDELILKAHEEVKTIPGKQSWLVYRKTRKASHFKN